MNNQIVKLLLEVEKRKSIWDITSEQYQNKHLRKVEWLEICHLMILDFKNLNNKAKDNWVKHLQKKWHCTKQNYLRSLGSVRNKPYRYGRYLEFLNSVILIQKQSPLSKASASVRRRKNYKHEQNADGKLESDDVGEDTAVGDIGKNPSICDLGKDTTVTTVSDVGKDTTVNAVKNTVVGVEKDTVVGVVKDTVVGVVKNTVVGVEKDTVVGVVKDTVVDVGKNTVLDVGKDTVADVKKSTTVDVAKGTTVDVAKGTTVDVGKVTTIDVGRGTTVEVKKGTAVDVGKGTTYNVTKGTTIDARQGTAFDVKKGTTVDVRKSTTVDVRKSTTVDDREGATVDVRKSTTVDVRRVTTDHIGKGTTVDVGKSTTAHVGKSITVSDVKSITVGMNKRQFNENGRERIKSNEKARKKIKLSHFETTDDDEMVSSETQDYDFEVESSERTKERYDDNENKASNSTALVPVKYIDRKVKRKFSTRESQNFKQRSCRHKTSTEKKLDKNSKNQVCLYLEKISRQNKENICDHLSFFRSLLPLLKHFPTKEAMKFRLEVMKIAIEYAEKPALSRNCNRSFANTFPTSSHFYQTPLNQNFHTDS